MGIGVLCLGATAVLWVAVGAVVSSSAKKGLNLAFIQGMTGVLLILPAIPAFFLGDISISKAALIALPAAGVLNYAVFFLMQKAMAAGPSGLTWAMVQSSFVMPFLMGTIFFREPCSLFRGIGIAVLIASMFLMGLSGKKEDSGRGEKRVWLLFTFGSYLTAGLCQCCCTLPSYFVTEQSAGIANMLCRVGVNFTGAVLAFLFQGLCNHKDFSGKGCRQGTAIFAASTLAATCCLFVGLDRMTAAGAGAVGYPVVMGLNITAFLIYTSFRLKERLSLASLLSVLLCLSGIVLLTIKF